MKENLLPKSSLLRTPKDYNRIYKKGTRIQGDNFSLIYTPSTEPGNRLGISIHGQLKGAVRRNRIKRIIREFFRTHKTFMQMWASQTQTSPAMDIIFAVRKKFSPNSPADVKQAVTVCIERQNSYLERASSESEAGSIQ